MATHFCKAIGCTARLQNDERVFCFPHMNILPPTMSGPLLRDGLSNRKALFDALEFIDALESLRRVDHEGAWAQEETR